MRPSANGGQLYHVHCSGVVAQRLRELQRQASQEGRGDQFLSAYRKALQRLARDPRRFGEPLYRLPAMRMQVRCGIVDPLVVDFGVCEDRLLVFIKGARLLSKPGT